MLRIYLKSIENLPKLFQPLQETVLNLNFELVMANFPMFFVIIFVNNGDYFLQIIPQTSKNKLIKILKSKIETGSNFKLKSLYSHL
jgi:hypothetical protein